MPLPIHHTCTGNRAGAWGERCFLKNVTWSVWGATAFMVSSSAVIFLIVMFDLGGSGGKKQCISVVEDLGVILVVFLTPPLTSNSSAIASATTYIWHLASPSFTLAKAGLLVLRLQRHPTHWSLAPTPAPLQPILSPRELHSASLLNPSSDSSLHSG